VSDDPICERASSIRFVLSLVGDIRLAGMLPDFNNEADVFWDRLKALLHGMGSCENFIAPEKFSTPCRMCQLGEVPLGRTKGRRPSSASGEIAAKSEPL